MKKKWQEQPWKKPKTHENIAKNWMWVQVIIDLKNITNDPAVDKVLTALCSSAIKLNKEISLSDSGGGHRVLVGLNSDGDSQKQLDVIADDIFYKSLEAAGVGFYASEEREAIEMLNKAGNLGVAIDPLDGSSNIDCNVSIGTIFSIKEIKDKNRPEDDFFVLGSYLASGYFIYGPQTLLVFTVGNGIFKFLLDGELNQFISVKSNLKIPEQTKEYAINSSNTRYWPTPVRSYIEELIDGSTGPRKKNYNTRWVASLVAETHRILERGGVFLYPGDDREGYSEGRLRKIYECGPIAFLVEQALGLATDGIDPILGSTAKSLHQRTPFVFGSKEEVETIKKFYEDPKSAHEPLFRTRGLFNR